MQASGAGFGREIRDWYSKPVLYQKKDNVKRRSVGIFIVDLFLPWNVLDTIDVQLVGDVSDDNRLELLPMARPSTL